MRQYNDPSANRQDNLKSNDRMSSADRGTENQMGYSITAAQVSPNSMNEHACPETMSTAEQTPAYAFDFLGNPHPDFSPLFSEDFNTPGENIWQFWDMFPDKVGEMFPVPFEYAQDQ